jgi:hypothetical protein
MSLPSRGSSPAANEESDLKKDIASHTHYNDSPRIKPKSPEERQVALKAALKLDPGVSPWSARALYFYLIVLCIFCCSGDNGFDGTVMSGINAMAQYQ